MRIFRTKGFLRSLFLATVFLPACWSQTVRLKNRTLPLDPAETGNPLLPGDSSADAPGLRAGHRIIQFAGPPQAEVVDAIKERGVRVLSDLPDNALLVGFSGRVDWRGLGIQFSTALEAVDKISPLVSDRTEDLLVEFHSDVDLGFARSLLLNLPLNLLPNQGLELRENPDLGPNRLMIHVYGTPGDAAARLAELDEVAYVFPASDDLVAGRAVSACVGALTANGVASQLIQTFGEGWDGPGKNGTTLSYFFSQMTAKLPTAPAQSEIQRAMAEWSKVIKLSWQPGSSATANRTVNILFGKGAHGDNYPFDGPGSVLAHTFYPAPPNPEPIAGDMHFDDDESWKIGANTDLFSVALHELGHALGLGHSDDPNDVMYPYYRMATTLAAGDKNAILGLYAPQDNAVSPNVPPPAAPLTLSVNVTPPTTAASSIALAGSAAGGSGTITVAWSTVSASGSAQMSGTNWSIASIPLGLGYNTITITATDGKTTVKQLVTVTRQAAATPKDTTPPSLTIASPNRATLAVAQASLAFNGTASDNIGVSGITWATNMGFSGVAAGTTKWSATVPLVVGNNTVIIRASDAAGNSSWRSVMVTRK